MRKIIIAILTLLLTAGAFACGGGGEEESMKGDDLSLIYGEITGRNSSSPKRAGLRVCAIWRSREFQTASIMLKPANCFTIWA